MKKVIVKCKLSDRDRFENKLSEIDRDFSPVYWQHDRIYIPRDFKHGANFPRLIMRTEVRATDMPAKYTLILRRHIEDSGIDMVEATPITNYVEMVNIILQLGFKLQTEVSRQRQEIQMDDQNVIYLDAVENHDGYYAKMESVLSDTDSAEDVREELRRMFASFGEKNITELAYSEY
jgi:predicted adenylyl cyclase CyaB